jgi:hypothetical protein
MPRPSPLALAVALLLALSPAFAEEAKKEEKPAAPPVPKPQFSGPYFGRMPRAFVEIVKADPAKRLLTVRLPKTGEVREVPIGGDTEMRIRDSWGDLSDLWPGQSVMLFVYHDAAGKWVYPRAVQDDVQLQSGHKWWWTVDAVDPAAGTVELSRREKAKDGEKVIKESLRVGPDLKVWKGEAAGGPDALKVGDVVLFQSRYDEGQKTRRAVEFFDEKGLAHIRAEQAAKHKARLTADGLPAVVNDLDILTGMVLVSVQWSASDAARGTKPGSSVTLKRTGGGEDLSLTAPVSESRADGVRHKLLLAATPADMARLRIGDEVRVSPAGGAGAVPTAPAKEK